MWNKAEFIVVGRSSEELGDRLPDIHFVHPGGMGMTRCDFTSRAFTLVPFSDRAARASQCTYTPLLIVIDRSFCSISARQKDMSYYVPSKP
jgi:hypothetical protein